MTSLSVIVAFRDSTEEQERARVWDWIKPLYAAHLPDAEVVVGTDDGQDPFHKTVALNRAFEQSSGDLILLADSDTWCPSQKVRDAVAMLTMDPSLWVRPWNIKLKLGQADTEHLLKKPAGSWDGQFMPGADNARRRENLNTYWAAPPWLFTREQYERVGGFDERFRGWGQEDEAFCLAMRSIVGRPKTILGTAIHLMHPRRGRSGKDQWIGEEPVKGRTPNEGLVLDYKRLVRYPDQMERFVRAR